MIRKLLSLVLALLMVAGYAFAAPEYMNMDSELPIVKDGETVTVKLVSLQADAYPSKPEDIWLWEYMRQAMNIDLQVEHVLQSAAEERLNLMMVSGDLPDIIVGFGLDTNELVRYGQVEGQLLDIAPYLTEEYAPNMVQWIEKFPEIKALITAPDGGIYSIFAYVMDVAHGPRFFVKESYLEEKGIALPSTLDEFTELLRTFKADYPDSTPLGGSENGNDPRAWMLTALGYLTQDSTGMSAALREGQVVIPAADETYGEFLKIMNTYYNEGLISPDFFTLDATAVNAQMAEGKNVASATGAPFLQLPNAEDFQQWTHAKPVTSEWNDTPMYVQGPTVNVGGMVFSANTEHPELLVRIADYFFSHEGGLYKWSGPWAQSEDTLGMTGGWDFEEGSDTSYFTVDAKEGKYPSTYAAIVSSIAPWGGSETFGCRMDINDPDDRFFHIKMMQAIAGKQTLGKVFREEYGDDFWRMTREENAMEYLTAGYPTVTYYTEEESIRINELVSIIQPHVKTETAKFITGVRSLDEFDKYLEELKDLGVEELLGFYTAAYETYLSNLG